LVGISGVFVNLGLYIILTRLFNIDFKIAAPIAIEVSILTNFTFNYIWTFKRRNSDSHWFTKLTKYHIVAGIAGIANYINFLALIYLLSMFDIIANLVGIAVGTLINYSLNSVWTWRETSGKKIVKKTGMIKAKP
jgi:dolichol-phosphate mannosyltransferase